MELVHRHGVSTCSSNDGYAVNLHTVESYNSFAPLIIRDIAIRITDLHDSAAIESTHSKIGRKTADRVIRTAVFYGLMSVMRRVGSLSEFNNLFP